MSSIGKRVIRIHNNKQYQMVTQELRRLKYIHDGYQSRIVLLATDYYEVGQVAWSGAPAEFIRIRDVMDFESTTLADLVSITRPLL